MVQQYNLQPIASTSRLTEPFARVSIQDDRVRSEKSQLLQSLKENKNHDELFKTLIPLLLDEEDSQIRIQIANQLLTCTSTAPLPTLRLHSSALLSSLSHALLLRQRSLPYAPPSNSILRFIFILLRIELALLTKLSEISPDLLATNLGVLAFWCYYRGTSDGTSSPRNRALEPARPLNLMGSFGTSPTKKFQRSSSRSSIESGSESEEESGRESKSGATQIRLEALSCIRLLALSNPKVLHPHWSFFFSESRFVFKNNLLGLVESDPSERVRLKAAQTLDALLQLSGPYLQIADDHTSKESFISLSSKLAEIVVQLHLKLGSILSSVLPNIELINALLKLSTTLVTNTPYNRLRKEILESITTATLTLLAHPIDSVVSAAGALLVAIIVNSSTASLENSIKILDQAQSLLDSTMMPSKRLAIWQIISVASLHIPNHDWSSIIDLAFTFISNSTSPQLFSTLLNHFTNLAKSNSSIFSSRSTLFESILRQAIASSEKIVRIAVCGVLATICWKGEGMEPVLEMRKLMGDREREVASAACRFIGIMVKHCSKQERAEIITELVGHCQQKGLVIVASWSLANCLDLAEEGDFESLEFIQYLGLSIELTNSSRGEKVQVNGIRCLGLLLKLSNTLDDDDGMVSNAIELLVNGLQSPSAKVRWNSATSIGHTLSTLAPSSRHNSILITALLETFSTPNFKVRLQSVAAITQLPRASYGTPEQFSVLLTRIELACEEIKLEFSSKESAHLTSLRIQLESCRIHLLSFSLSIL